MATAGALRPLVRTERLYRWRCCTTGRCTRADIGSIRPGYVSREPLSRKRVNTPYRWRRARVLPPSSFAGDEVGTEVNQDPSDGEQNCYRNCRVKTRRDLRNLSVIAGKIIRSSLSRQDRENATPIPLPSAPLSLAAFVLLGSARFARKARTG